MIYAGIGARATPLDALYKMSSIAFLLAQKGHVLRSGGALGADQAFKEGADQAFGVTEIFRPHDGFQQSWFDCAKAYHPNWAACSPIARALHARNSPIVLGYNLDAPVDFIVCWTANGAVAGGTGQALRIAADRNIPVFNLANHGDEARMWSKGWVK